MSIAAQLRTRAELMGSCEHPDAAGVAGRLVRLADRLDDEGPSESLTWQIAAANVKSIRVRVAAGDLPPAALEVLR